MSAYICVTYAHDDRQQSDLFCRGLARYGFRYSCVNELSDGRRRRELIRNASLLLALTSPAAADAETVAADIRQALELGMKVICVSLEAGELESRFCAGAVGGAVLIPFPAEDTPDRHGRALFVHRLFVRHLACLGDCFSENACADDEYGRVIRLAVSAHGENGSACYALGRAYELGLAVPFLEKEAAYWMSRAASWEIPDAMVRLGQMRFLGMGAERDPAEAFRLFTRVAELGDIRGVYHVGLCYLEGQGAVKDPVRGAEYLQTAADAGYAPALYRMGLLHRDGVGVERDVSLALRYLYAAYCSEARDAEDDSLLPLHRRGRVYACVTMRRLRRLRSMPASAAPSEGSTDRRSRRLCFGRCRVVSDDLPEDTWDLSLADIFGQEEGERPASRRYTPADMEENNAARAAFELGRLLAVGCEARGLQPAPTRALVWYRYAARMGHAEAAYELANAYRRGYGTPAVPARAASLYRLAADAGYIPAQFAFGVCCEQGIGMAVDTALAVRYYEQAAEAGFAPAQNNLGGCYEHGIGVVQNILTAVEWYAAAAQEGQAESICRLGVCYETGRGVTADPEKALRLYREAAELGNGYACYRLALCYDRGINPEEEDAEVLMTEAALAASESAETASESAAPTTADTHTGADRGGNAGFAGGESAGGLRPPVTLKTALNESGAMLRLRPDRARAIALYRQAADAGVAYASYALYLCHRMERGAYRDPAAELRHLKRASDGGCLQAAYELGLCYLDGTGTPVDRSRALDCFAKAVAIWRAHTKDVHWYARALDADGLPPDGLSLKQGAGDALYMQGFCAMYGLDREGARQADPALRPGAEDLRRATALFREAASIHHVGSLVMLGDLYTYGLLHSDKANAEDKALGYYLEAVRMEKDVHTRGIAMREQTDNTVDARMSLARQALRVAAAETDEGTAEMARVNAWRSFSESAERGSVDALVGMAECLFHGCGAPRNPGAAIRLLRRAEHTKGGRVAASLWLGDALQSRWGELNDPAEADAVYVRGLQIPCLESECGLHTMGLRRLERKEADRRVRTEILYRLASLRAIHFSDAANHKEAFPYLAEAVLMGHEGARDDLARMFSFEMTRPKGAAVKAKRGKERSARGRLRRLRDKSASRARSERAQWVHRSWMTDYYRALWPEPTPFSLEMRPTTVPTDRPAFATAPVTDLMRVNALQYLGECFYEGYGLPADPAAAVTCYRMVLDMARTGGVESASVTEAAYSLGWCLLYGVGVDANEETARIPEAMGLLTKASRNHGGACYTLGLCHEEGRGVVAADDREALRFYRKAQKLGHPLAAGKIAKLEKRVLAGMGAQG